MIKLFGEIQPVYAHCDIPCGIYDPHRAQIAALTVVRMIDLLGKAGDDAHTVARLTVVKEEHAEICKHEVRIIWGDYMKGEKLDGHPEIHTLVHQIMALASGAKQGIDRKAALDLLTAVNQFSEIFWQTKGVKTKRVKAPYEPKEELIYPDL